jgi:oligoribonuclease NrnB/cAMP/cGMP phosphodiesterase (DHH superfamily)
MVNKPLVIYHGNCADGFTAAWACWLLHPDWEYFAASHGGPLPDVKDKYVYMLDFCYKEDIMLAMSSEADFIKVIDHHKSAQQNMATLSGMSNKFYFIFDMEKSGARLAWEYFHPGPTVPKLVKYVEDRDLWRSTLLYSKSVNAYIFSKKYDFNEWNALHTSLEKSEDFLAVAQLGKAILDKQDKDVQELVSNKFRFNIAGHSVWLVNLPYTLASDACMLICQGEPFAASYYYDGYSFAFSLRSDPNGLDVSEIAAKFGGGGHKHAAGFSVIHPLVLNLNVMEKQ